MGTKFACDRLGMFVSMFSIIMSVMRAAHMRSREHRMQHLLTIPRTVKHLPTIGLNTSVNSIGQIKRMLKGRKLYQVPLLIPRVFFSFSG